MAGEQERRFQKVMDKLYHAPKLNSSSSLMLSSSSGGRKRQAPGLRGALERRSRLPVSSPREPPLGPPPPCRPWDRADLIKRLATFKALTWFGKPQSVSPINCARRGWINVDTDVLTCEACGARLVFSTSTSWSREQVEKAAAVFSLKLDNGHKMLCPWIDNACDKELAFFPPTPPEVLVEGYKERASVLLRLTGLPVISTSAIRYMKSPQLEQFLSQGFNQSFVLGNGIKLIGGEDPECASHNVAVDAYYQALKIISLCGWEPRLLPYAVDCEDQTNLLTKSTSASECIVQMTEMPGQARNNIIVHSSSIPAGLEVGNETHPSLGEDRYDPASIVLDCRFCGACVGIWAFPTAKCPLELFRLVADFSGRPGSSAVNNSDVVRGGESSKTQNSGEANQFTKKGSTLIGYDGSTTKEKPVGLNSTIAGGPPPVEQNFRPRVSFPVISRHLRAVLGNVPGAENCIRSSISCTNQVDSQCYDVPLVQEKDTQNGLVLQPEGLGKRKRSEDAERSNCVDEENAAGVSSEQANNNLQETHSLNECSGTMQNLEAHENELRSGSAVTSNVHGGNPSDLHHGESENNHLDLATSTSATNTASCSTPTDSSNNDKASDSCKLDDAHVNSTKVSGLESKTLSSTSTIEIADNASGNDQLVQHTDIRGFDPIHQHRPFCPWIATENGDNMTGWKLTLSALINQEKDHSLASNSEAPSIMIDEDDDPVVSVRKLFMSPPAKRLKSSR